MFLLAVKFPDAGAHIGVAFRSVVKLFLPATLLHAGAHSGVACWSVVHFVFCSLYQSYTLVPIVVSRAGVL